MIVVKLDGQLGNQLFQYATAYALAKESTEKLSIFDFDYKTIYRRLGNQLKYLSLDNTETFYPSVLYVDTFRKMIFRICNKTYRGAYSNKYGQYEYVKEVTNKYIPITISDGYKYHILKGYFQSYRYFEQYKDDLLRQFIPNFELSTETLKYIDMIKNDQNSVSLHVRRGDYVKAGLDIDRNYYELAIRKMLSYNENANIYAFSDDIDWVKKHVRIQTSKVIYIKREQFARPFEDMWLMSKARCNIIANSTFSWWAAYLNCNLDKVVIAPKKLINNNSDIIPNDWIII